MSIPDLRPFPPTPDPAPPPSPAGADRRRHPRLTTTRAAKVFLPAAMRYAASETSDISAGGALLKVDRARRLAAGDRLDVAVINPAQPAAVLESKSMLPARVVRVTPIDHFHQAVAVEFDAPAADLAVV